MQSQTFVQNDPNSLPAIDPATGLPIQVTRIDPTLTNESYVLSSFFTASTGPGIVRPSPRRQLEPARLPSQRRVAEGLGHRRAVSRTLSGDMTASARLGWTSYEDLGTGPIPGTGNGTAGTDTESSWNADVLLTKRLSERSSVSGIYRYISEVGAFDTGSFGSAGTSDASGPENRITLVFNHSF